MHEVYMMYDILFKISLRIFPPKHHDTNRERTAIGLAIGRLVVNIKCCHNLRVISFHRVSCCGSIRPNPSISTQVKYQNISYYRTTTNRHSLLYRCSNSHFFVDAAAYPSSSSGFSVSGSLRIPGFLSLNPSLAFPGCTVMMKMKAYKNTWSGAPFHAFFFNVRMMGKDISRKGLC